MQVLGRRRRTLLLFLCALPVALSGQATSPRTVLAGTLNLLGAGNLPGLSLTGTEQTVAGSTQDSGTFTASCGIGGTISLTLQLSAGAAPNRGRSRISSRPVNGRMRRG